MWQKRHSLSVCVWFQDWAHLSPESTVPVHSHPHRSLNNCFSISVQFFSQVAPHFFGQHESPSNLAKSRYPCEGPEFCKVYTSRGLDPPPPHTLAAATTPPDWLSDIIFNINCKPTWGADFKTTRECDWTLCASTLCDWTWCDYFAVVCVFNNSTLCDWTSCDSSHTMSSHIVSLDMVWLDIVWLAVVWLDVVWLIHMCDMTDRCVSHDSTSCDWTSFRFDPLILNVKSVAFFKGPSRTTPDRRKPWLMLDGLAGRTVVVLQFHQPHTLTHDPVDAHVIISWSDQLAQPVNADIYVYIYMHVYTCMYQDT